MDLRVTDVDVDGVLQLLGSHLYTTPTVAIRELVQNAHDSIVRRRMEDLGFEGGEIRLSADPVRRTLTVWDDGTGMTDDEIAGFLATIGAGATRQVREASGSEDLIGLFGVGFLSAFVVGRRVSVETTSFRDRTRGWWYQSAGGRQYTLREVAPQEPGTRVVVELTDAAAPLCDPPTLAQVTRRFCVLLRVPVYVGDASEPLNLEPPWRPGDGGAVEHPVEAARRRREFAAAFEPLEPLATIPVEPSDHCEVRGLLWVQGAKTYGALDNRNLSVFVRGMLLDDDARELLPPWAGFVGGVVESPALRPTASREDLQRDEAWFALRDSIARQLVAELGRLPGDEPEAWRRVLRRHNEYLLGAAVADPGLFALLADAVTVPTTEGELHVREIVRRSRGRVHVGVGEAGGFEETVFRAMKVPIASGSRYAVLPFLRGWGADRHVEVVELGTARGDRQVFASAPLDEAARRWFADAIGDPGDDVVPARFAPACLPLVCFPDREVELKKRLESDEADARISRSALALARAYTATIDGTVRRRVFLNLDNPAVARLLEVPPERRHPVATGLLRALKRLTAGPGAGGYELDAALAEFTAAITFLLEDGG